MNFIANNSKYLFNTISNALIKPGVKRNAISYKYFKQIVLYENKNFIHTRCALLAGHSKWSNIKNTKQAKDQAKSKAYVKIIKSIKIACREGGNTNVKLNSHLAKVIDQARAINMPQTTIDRAIQNIQKAAANGKPHTLTLKGLNGEFIVIDVMTDNFNRTRSEIRAFVKKSGFQDVRAANIESLFNEKGIIVAKGEDINKAMEDAIVAGAEDVAEEDGSLKFVCDPIDFHKVKHAIEGLTYDVEYASVDKIPYVMIPVSETDAEMLQAILEKVEEHQDVLKVTCNFEL